MRRVKLSNSPGMQAEMRQWEAARVELRVLNPEAYAQDRWAFKETLNQYQEYHRERIRVLKEAGVYLPGLYRNYGTEMGIA